MSRGLDVESSFYLRVIDPNYLYSSHPYLKVPISPLLLVLEVCIVKPTYRKSCAANLLMSELTLDPSFKVKRG